MTNFERGFYADPTRTTTHGGGTSSSSTSSCTRPDDRRAPDWAAKIHVALAPVYYQNYLLGELVASQIQSDAASIASVASSDRPAVGAFLTDAVFGPGWSLRWDELIRPGHRRARSCVDAFAAELAELSEVAALDSLVGRDG